MILASITIDGQEYKDKTLIEGFTLTSSTGDRLGTCDMVVWGTAVDLNAILIPGKIVEVIAGAYTVGPPPPTGTPAMFGGTMFGEATFGQSDEAGSGGQTELHPTERIFYGRITTVEPTALTVQAGGTGYTQFKLTCRNWADLMNTAIVTAAVTYQNITDQDIIKDLFSMYMPDIAVAEMNVAVATWFSSITFDNISLRQCLENIVKQSAAEFYVDSEKALQYHMPPARPAPFGISETPDNQTTFAPLRTPVYRRDFSNGANRVKVIGGPDPSNNNVPLTVTRDDINSQALYGIMSKVIVDRSISTPGEAQLRGDVELKTYASPLRSVNFSTLINGLEIGMMIPIDLPAIGLNSNPASQFLIRKITATWMNSSVTRYAVETGDYMPDLARSLRKLAQEQSQTVITQITQGGSGAPPDGSVTIGSFAEGLRPISMVSVLPALPNSLYPTDSVVVWSADHKLYRNDGSRWTAMVKTEDLDGYITNTQIGNEAIDTPQLKANSVKAGIINAGAVLSGCIVADAVTAGCIDTHAIRATDFCFEVGAIRDADIYDLSATKLTAGTIDANVITVNNLNASKITTGVMSASRLTAGTIDLSAGGIISFVWGISSIQISTGGFTLNGVTFTAIYGGSSAQVSGGAFMANGSTYYGTALGSTGGYRIQNVDAIDSSRNFNAASYVKIGLFYAPMVPSTGIQIKYGTSGYTDGSGQVVVSIAFSTLLSFVGTMGDGGAAAVYAVSAAGSNITLGTVPATSGKRINWIAIGT